MIKHSVKYVIHVHVMLHRAKDFPLYLLHHLWFVAIEAGALPVSQVCWGCSQVHTLDSHSALALR